MTEPTSQVNEIIQSSFESVYEAATLKERKMLGYWLEEMVNTTEEPEALSESLHSTIACLKRGVFPDPL